MSRLSLRYHACASLCLLAMIGAEQVRTASCFLPATTRTRLIIGSGDTHSITSRIMFQLGVQKKDDNLSAAGKERRDEDARRQLRKTDVVIGKTSAMAGARDYPIDPKSTEEAWMKQASNLEQKVYRQTEVGMEMLKMLRVEEAVAAFDAVFQLKPNVYCWQAGIARFYMGDWIGAAEIFCASAKIYESKFGSPASEERIWRDACELKYLTSLSKKEKEAMVENGGVKEVIPQVKEFERSPDSTVETRRVFRIAKDLFAASVTDDSVGLVLSRAKLRSICGTFEANPRADRKMWKLNSWFYLGLHYDALGQVDDSKSCMKMAMRMCPNIKGSDIIHTLPMLHMSRRDWFDDDEYNNEDDQIRTPQGAPIDVPLGVKTDPIIIESIHDSISTLKHQDLKHALKARGLLSSGSKEELRMRLFTSLISDAGLQL